MRTFGWVLLAALPLGCGARTPAVSGLGLGSGGAGNCDAQLALHSLTLHIGGKSTSSTVAMATVRRHERGGSELGRCARSTAGSMFAPGLSGAAAPFLDGGALQIEGLSGPPFQLPRSGMRGIYTSELPPQAFGPSSVIAFRGLGGGEVPPFAAQVAAPAPFGAPACAGPARCAVTADQDVTIGWGDRQPGLVLANIELDRFPTATCIFDRAAGQATIDRSVVPAGTRVLDVSLQPTTITTVESGCTTSVVVSGPPVKLSFDVR